MRVLIYGFSGKILGGIETFILNMNEHMSKDTVFDYVIDGEQCVYRDRIEKRGGRIFFVPGVRKHPFGYIHSFWRTLGEQRAVGTRIFYVQLFSMANVLPVFLAKMRGYKIILHAHNSGLHSKSIVYKVAHKAGQFLVKCCKCSRFTNSSISSAFMFGKNAKSELIYNAIDTNRFSFHQDWRDSIRQEMSCEDNKVIGFVGRLSHEKNPLFMIKVFTEYLKINANSELWIVGEGEHKLQMQQEIEKAGIGNCVKWLGRRDDVNKIMCGMDLLLQPSKFEGLGIVLIEAQATGLPCVSSAGVIPKEAEATKLLFLQNLNSNFSSWAHLCNEVLQQSSLNGSRDQVKIDSSYAIDKEAKRLENILLKHQNL